MLTPPKVVLLCLSFVFCSCDMPPGSDEAGREANPIGASPPAPALHERSTRGTASSLLGCADLATATRAEQVAIITADTGCAGMFVNLLVTRPDAHLGAFYDLIASPATEPLFFAVYSAMGRGAFLFDEPAILDLYVGLPAAISRCGTRSRCADWQTFVASRLDSGGLYRCPVLATRARSELMQVLPHGDYSCVEDLAVRLAPLADNAMVDALRAGGAAASRPWARRNHLRVLGRLATGALRTARTLVTVTRRIDVLSTLHTRLGAESADEAMHDIIWILDTSFYPDYGAEATLETIAESATRSAAIRFRGIGALTRLYTSKSVLDVNDVAFLQRNARSDDPYVRAQVAFYLANEEAAAFPEGGLRQLLDALTAQLAVETALVAQVYEARALDRHRGGTREVTLRTSYEAAHLPNRIVRGPVMIRSGLPMAELGTIADLLDAERAAFPKLLGGTPFDTAVPADTNPSMVLIVFATRAEYREYMDAFIGAGRDNGGLYLERVGTLYTFQRTPAESRFTLQELIQHEYSHYLQGRFIYPGVWGEPGDFAEPRGWADEGLAEVLAGLELGSGGTYTMPPRATHLATLCGTTRKLGPLFALRAGYDAPGEFDYAGGWSYVYFLISERPTRARDTYLAWRARTYRRTNVHTLAGSTSLAALESAHQTALNRYCASYPLAATAASAARALAEPSAHVPHMTDTPSAPALRP